jgi:hypothetical protein
MGARLYAQSRADWHLTCLLWAPSSNVSHAIVPYQEASMVLRSKDERIRGRAYTLWEEDGALEGCADEYWRQAREQIEGELRREENGDLPDNRS